jgi:hypothetical protein
MLQKINLSKPTDMTFHRKALEEHFSDGTISFSVQPFSGEKMHFLNLFFSKQPQSLKS